jgi:hypothetical protein
MANENPTSGYTRICGGLKHLGYVVARNSMSITGLVPYVVLFVMKLKTRTVQIAGISRKRRRDLNNMERSKSLDARLKFGTWVDS